MATRDPHVQAHLEWLGFVQHTDRDGPVKPPPPGLVVSATALARAGAILPRNDAETQRTLVEVVAADEPVIPDFDEFARRVLGWSFSAKYYAREPSELTGRLHDLGEELRPDIAVRERGSAEDWQLLVRVLEPGHDLDRVERDGGQLEASAHGRMERLLRETGVSAGLLCNGRALRLISAPAGRAPGGLSLDPPHCAVGRPIGQVI